jgi:predicted dehydrogenase
MRRFSRRTFLKRSALTAGAVTALAPHSRVLGANDDLRLATVGFNGQGGLHIRLLRELPGVRVVAVCDADQRVLDKGVQQAKERNETVETYQDVRKLLENKNVDAVTTATPDHWHALVTIWACQAGKDVYCEKPLGHNLWEGRKVIEAVKKYQRIVQWGNQEHGHHTGAMQLEKEGLGKILTAYTALNRGRQSIGKVDGPQPVPESIDYNLWCGPAPMEPLMRRRLHYDWHWVWPTGTGEIGNNGIYELDALRLRLGQSTLPKRVMSLGGRFLFNDDGTTPNAQMALFQYDPGPLVLFELRNFPSKEGPKTLPTRVTWEKGESGLPGLSGPEGNRGGFSRHKGQLYNFTSVVRTRNPKELRATVLEGHLSTALVHMANISYRLGSLRPVGEVREALQDRGDKAVEVFDGFRKHLEANGVDFSKTELVLGPWLEMDPEKEQFVGGSDVAGKANQLVRGSYREPFVVPERV